MTLNKTKTYKHNIGENIRLWREFKGIKQEDLGKLIGKSKTTMSKIETRNEPPNSNVMEDIADALGINPWQLYTSPQHQITLTNCANCNGINNGTHTVNYIMPKELIDKHFSLMEKIAANL